jgi:hypothetical protein
MKRLHRLVGLFGIAAFLATGVYMRRHDPALHSLDSATRLLFRSRHIYLLLASLLNLNLGTYLSSSPARWRRKFQSTGSVLILAAPFVLLCGFIVEPRLTDLRPSYTQPAIIGLVVASLLHAVGGSDAGRSKNPADTLN